MKPIIGVSSNLTELVLSVPTDNIHAVTRFGGVPIVLPNMETELIDSIANLIDGLLLTGGGDIDPTLFGEEPHRSLGSIVPERDEFEVELIKKMLEQNKPILGLCRGAQIMSIAAGGDMYQDIYGQIETTLLQHDQKAPRTHASHFVQLGEGTVLKHIIGKDRIKVNSFHHQAVRKIPQGYQISGIASDGIIEAFESQHHSFVIGIQWHPECLVTTGDDSSEAIFKGFIEACKNSSKRLSFQ
ncbi:gamma-glutamyl-gamma-aminobutyrate hydrolase family protein [Psychrobacillus sp. FSL W7-1457]|uniref:gamma-glutamyl-gamma-aminobutyrate hydrolase family protein n=1 Tax=Psychrobacillus sp. FSL W7-1457 TaxID=2954547 RepID=UPI00315A7649